MRMLWTGVIDPVFDEELWKALGVLKAFLRTLRGSWLVGVSQDGVLEVFSLCGLEGLEVSVGDLVGGVRYLKETGALYRSSSVL